MRPRNRNLPPLGGEIVGGHIPVEDNDVLIPWIETLHGLGFSENDIQYIAKLNFKEYERTKLGGVAKSKEYEFGLNLAKSLREKEEKRLNRELTREEKIELFKSIIKDLFKGNEED